MIRRKHELPRVRRPFRRDGLQHYQIGQITEERFAWVSYFVETRRALFLFPSSFPNRNARPYVENIYISVAYRDYNVALGYSFPVSFPSHFYLAGGLSVLRLCREPLQKLDLKTDQIPLTMPMIFKLPIPASYASQISTQIRRDWKIDGGCGSKKRSKPSDVLRRLDHCKTGSFISRLSPVAFQIGVTKFTDRWLWVPFPKLLRQRIHFSGRFLHLLLFQILALLSFALGHQYLA